MNSLLRLPVSIFRPFYEKTHFHKGVITELDDADLQKAYTHCRSITRIHAKTFYMATRFLPNHKQRSIFAIYGLCRYLDDLVDEAEDLIHNHQITEKEVEQRLDTFKQNLVNSYNGLEQSDPILIAFFDTLKTYNISLELPLLLLEGVKMDLIKNRYASFDELYDYSYKVASVVGLMTSEVFGYSDKKALDYAVDLGIAMQLTNILRDIGEDLNRDRIYLPEDELQEYGISKQSLIRREKTPEFIQFMKFQIARARRFYAEADKGVSMLTKDSRLPVLLARENYSRILDKIEENNYNVFNERAYLNSTEKFSILPKVVYHLKTRK
ncbi:phytoene/squalene synthase family protein [Rhodohalobacter sp. SW132]|uniref:phytoene/squalene synthase family protein n=1 Tax=Rhodohalobacter sp. SW132 TaxID=2293433 RepID=UPI000E259484|nr:squalene/phytoene synthase family protein [Rhodohalobacter sp. SW132]REL33606.1 phytoene/squalene synthase family protein [Rhodohalobacter sp. SW132]